MRLSIVKLVFGKELRELLRDRRSLMAMFGIPLLIYPLITVIAGGASIKEAKELSDHPTAGETTRAPIAVIGGEGAPHLLAELSKEGSGLELETPDDPEAALRDGRVRVIVRVPPDDEARELRGEGDPIRITVDRSRMSTSAAERRVNRAITAYEKYVLRERLASHGLDERVLRPVPREVQDRATGDQRLGLILSMVLPILLLLTGMLGAFFPALTATTSEREHGTFETLLVSPVSKTELLVGKASFVLMCAMLTSALNLLSMSLVLWQLLTGVSSDKQLGPLSLSPASLALTYVAAVPTLVAFSALTILVGLVARTFREGSSYATPIMLLPIGAMAVSLGDPTPTPGLLATPVIGTTLIIRAVLTGRATAGAFVIAFVSSALVAGLVLSAAARIFTSESLTNASWEPLSFKGLRGRAKSLRAPRLPAVDEAIALVLATTLLVFYLGAPLLARGIWWVVLGSELLLLVPTLLYARVAKLSFRASFLLERPGPGGVLGALLLGLGLTVLVDLVFVVQSRFAPPPAEYLRLTSQMFAEPLAQNPVSLPIALGLSAGVAEELLYRGPLQVALFRKAQPWVALLVSGLLFAAAHLDVYGFFSRMLLGVIFGVVAWKTRSVVPSMIAHATYDTAQLLGMSMHVRAMGVARVVDEASRPAQMTLEPKLLVAGALALALGTALLAGDAKRQSTKR